MTTVLLPRWTTLLQLKQGLQIFLLHKAYIFVQICAILNENSLLEYYQVKSAMFTPCTEHIFQSLDKNSPLRRRDKNKTSVICSN